MALRVECASNLRQDGLALREYAAEYQNMYPPMYGATVPWGPYSTLPNVTPYPEYGLLLLYYSSWNESAGLMTNIQPGILVPNAQGLALLFSTEPGYNNEQLYLEPAQSWMFNSAGLLRYCGTYFYGGYDYWVDRGSLATGDYTASDDVTSRYSPGAVSPDWTNFNPDPSHPYATTPNSVGAALLMSDQIDMNGLLPNSGGYMYGTTPASDHTGSDGIAEGGHLLYNDGSVAWKPFSQMRPRFTINGSGLYQWW